MPIKDLTSERIYAELWCPDCTCFFEFDGTLDELAKFVEDHDCSDEDGGDD